MAGNWKPIQGFEGIYEISEGGKVWSHARTMKRQYGRTMSVPGKVLAAHGGKVQLYDLDGVRHNWTVATLMRIHWG